MMKNRISRLPALTANALILAFFIASALGAESVLRVDFGKSTLPLSPVQSDFVSFATSVNAAQGPLKETFSGLGNQWTQNGTLTVTLASGPSLTDTNNLLSRDREEVSEDNGAFHYRALYRDTIIAQNKPHMVISVAGLKPETIYDVRLFAYDNTEQGTSTFTDETGTGSESATITWTPQFDFVGDKDDINEVFSTTLRIKSDNQGNITILNQRMQSSSANRQAIINGLEIQPVP